MSERSGTAPYGWRTSSKAAERLFPARRLPADGLEAWRQVIDAGYEGYVAKDEASVYVGGVTRAWLKVKQKGWTLEEDRWQRRFAAGIDRAMRPFLPRASPARTLSPTRGAVRVRGG
jgi:hypothetical protein